jgi:hypothetical protein
MMTIRAVMSLGVFAFAAWLGGFGVAHAQTAPSGTSNKADIGFDFIPGPSSDQGLGKVVTGTSAAWGAHGNYSFNLGPLVQNVGLDYRNWQSTVAGTATNYGVTDIDFRIGEQIPFITRTFLTFGYLIHTTPLGSMGGPGAGIDVLPHYDHHFAVYGSVMYYPVESGTYSAGFPPGTAPAGPTLAAREIKYRVGVVYGIGPTPFFIDLGVAGDTGKQGNNQSNNYSEGGFFLGLRAAVK